MNPEEEILLAQKIQKSILPKGPPYLENYEIAAFTESKLAVGGDFYGYVPLLSGPKTIGLYVGDVVDKGVPAAMYMMLVSGILKAGLSFGKNMSPRDTLQWLNLQLFQTMPGIDEHDHNMYVTMLYGVLDANTNTFNYARGGHERIYRTDTQGDIAKYKDGLGQALGMFKVPKLAKGNIYIPQGGMLVLYTDGITDETDAEDVFFGKQKLEDILTQNKDKSAQEISSVVREELHSYRDSTSHYDDSTLMVVKRG